MKPIISETIAISGAVLFGSGIPFFATLGLLYSRGFRQFVLGLSLQEIHNRTFNCYLGAIIYSVLFSLCLIQVILHNRMKLPNVQSPKPITLDDIPVEGVSIDDQKTPVLSSGTEIKNRKRD